MMVQTLMIVVNYPDETAIQPLILRIIIITSGNNFIKKEWVLQKVMKQGRNDRNGDV